MTRTAIVNVPRTEPHRPPPGSAIIAAVCKSLGHEVIGYDLNIDFFHYCKAVNVDYYEFDYIWENVSAASPHHQDLLNIFISDRVVKIVNGNFDHVMISVFGFSGQPFTEQFITKLRPMTSAKITAGGPGISYAGLLDSEDCYGKNLYDRGLIDCYITGEGEFSLRASLNQEQGPGINNNRPVQIDDLDSLPFPDYSVFDLDAYDYLIPGEKDVYITGSRGCVRKCTYCDVEHYWPKYRYRSGRSITQEIIQNYEKFGITRFYFTDSLVNGSLKSFNEMCESLVRYNFVEPIKWQGQFIFRPKQSIPKDHFAMIKAAGGDTFFVGIETGSDRVRFEMGKKFTNEDIDYQLQECSNNDIKIMPLLFTGYITETAQDHQDNLDLFRRWQKYVADGTITGVELGSNLMILPGAPVERMIESHGLEFMMSWQGEPGTSLWWSAANPELTVRERIRRKLEVHETAIKYAWPVWRQESRLNALKNQIIKNNLHDTTPKKFYKLVTEGDRKSAVFSREI